MRKLLLTLIAVLMIGAVQAAGTATPAEARLPRLLARLRSGR